MQAEDAARRARPQRTRSGRRAETWLGETGGEHEEGYRVGSGGALEINGVHSRVATDPQGLRIVALRRGLWTAARSDCVPRTAGKTAGQAVHTRYQRPILDRPATCRPCPRASRAQAAVKHPDATATECSPVPALSVSPRGHRAPSRCTACPVPSTRPGRRGYAKGATGTTAFLARRAGCDSAGRGLAGLEDKESRSARDGEEASRDRHLRCVVRDRVDGPRLTAFRRPAKRMVSHER